MASVAIVYQSKFGHTKAVAEAVGRGVESVENTVLHLMDVEHDMAQVCRVAPQGARRWGSSHWIGLGVDPSDVVEEE